MSIDGTDSNHCAIECYMTSFMTQFLGRLKLIVYFEVSCCDVTGNVVQPDKKLLPGGNSVFFQTVFIYDAF